MAYSLSATTPRAAYSMRKVVGSYSGPAIRISVGGTLTDIGFTAAGDLDTAALMAAAGSGDAQIVTWYDQSPGAVHATNSSTGPMIVKAGVLQTINGKPAAYFNDNLLGTTGYAYWKGPFTVIAANHLTDNSAWGTWISHTWASGRSMAFGYHASGTLALDFQANGATDVSSDLRSTKTPEIVTWTSAAGRPGTGVATTRPYLNGVSGSGDLSINFGGDVTGDVYQIGKAFSSGDRYIGYIGEIIIWDSVISDRAAAETASGSYYGVTGYPVTPPPEPANTANGSVVEAADTTAGDLSAKDPVVTTMADGAVVEGLDAAAGTVDAGEIPIIPGNAIGAHTLTGFSMLGGRDDVLSVQTLTGSTMLTPRVDIVSAQTLVGLTVLGAVADLMSTQTLVGYVLLAPPEPPPFVPGRPVGIRRREATVEHKRVPPPNRTLPQPPDQYDRVWQQQVHEQVIQHLDDTVSLNSANPHVILSSPNGKTFKVTIGDDGKLTAEHVQG